MAEGTPNQESQKRFNSENNRLKEIDYIGYYDRDSKLGSMSAMYHQYPLMMLQPETKLSNYRMLAKWNPSYVHFDTNFRRRLQSKDNTGALRLWLLRHKKNPYPTKPEKIMLAILSRMTMTQVSTWFANARRRLKKEFPDSDDFNQTDNSEDDQSLVYCQSIYMDPK